MKRIPRRLWKDWRWQVAHSLCDSASLAAWIPLTKAQQKSIDAVTRFYRMKITPYCARLIAEKGHASAFRRQFLPSLEEIRNQEGVCDPKNERAHMPAESLCRIYPDRVAFLLTGRCASMCRFCFRKHSVTRRDHRIDRSTFSRAIDYIVRHKNIRDVLLTGGDPLMEDDAFIEKILRALRRIRHVEMIRIGTRVLSTLPQRITPALVRMMKRYHPVWINTHFNHPSELTPEVRRAIVLLLEGGFPLNNQSVLLKGVNDSASVMKSLIRDLLKARIRPYYLFQGHGVKGGVHFQASVASGKAIMRTIGSSMTGLGMPRYVISTPQGKIPLVCGCETVPSQAL
ncbi:MAG: KamA family radical SAM protein [Candidatus Omnitrophota bacterium]